METASISLLALIFASLLVQAHTICDSSNEVLGDICFKLYQQIEDAVLADKGNIYRLRKAFFYAPNANPVLMKVVYNIAFAENVTRKNAINQSNYCVEYDGTNETTRLLFAHVDNSVEIILGWTSNGVFTVFHPLTLNFMQIQIPFLLMKILFNIFSKIDPTESGPEAATLLWDGSYELPTLYINLHFTTIPCIPTNGLFASVLRDFNSLLRIYAGQEITGIIQDSGNTHLVGFTLEEFKVSPKDVRKSSDFWFYLVYVVSTIILYVTCVTAIFFLVSKTKERGMLVGQSFAAKNPEVLKGVMIVVIAFIALEFCTELIMSIIWAAHVKDPIIIILVLISGLVYYSPGFFSFFKVCQKCHKFLKGEYEDREQPKHDALFNCFVWIMAYFAYILMYAFFPAFVLSFAYPTRIITIFAYIVTFVVFSVVYLVTFLKNGITLHHLNSEGKGHEGLELEFAAKKKSNGDSKSREKGHHEPFVQNDHEPDGESGSKEKGEDKPFAQKETVTNGKSGSKEKELKAFVQKTIVCIVMTTILVYFFLFVFALLYSLVIGRASVVSSAPLAILSLLPSIMMTVFAWIIKSTVFNTEHENPETNANLEQPINVLHTAIQIDASATLSEAQTKDQLEAVNTSEAVNSEDYIVNYNNCFNEVMV